MGDSDEVVIRVVARIHRAHAVEFAHQNRGEQMVYGEGIVRMALQDLLKILHGGVVVEVVIVLEGCLVQWILRTINDRIPGIVSLAQLGEQQHCDDGKCGAKAGKRQEHAYSV